jgi:hypothetical protein
VFGGFCPVDVNHITKLNAKMCILEHLTSQAPLKSGNSLLDFTFC